ncbi:mercuric transporter MerT family protein [Phaeobacter gallaeciensis]|uniref:mercuric transporter MerT family protein n=1 Tax=Phaeobacter gallaeciensis TaxID=60890 RepID=UPI00237FA4EE|nr:mercuric transporter MerT family protein [Phaeobacter gallaeciensis]MDE4099709.1 mercuric transporter MerT family protein [Phaeobacter gallaeciensis]MDE4108556.1 mercuric transporter MerT family protein [Phaeobacter gallaeciensis]MDE4110428.1 mercuric transporter MerT family protein [Phaeobacter gallaeciensis]MDE4117350.1 mercuric transporter MerT family protein [Phaeobacter gallaeciensis]MDE4121823.1 mercuric transporter MerT family protein [Phaeobacter gallaeciensis]
MGIAEKQTGQVNTSADRSSKGWLAAGGLLGAGLASACCVGPLVLLTLGISGAWIGNLTALEPYKPVFALIALGFIGAGFWHVYFRKPVICKPGSYCARPSSSRITKTALWVSLVLVVAALTIAWWAPFFY